jgi:hypothetical protein
MFMKWGSYSAPLDIDHRQDRFRRRKFAKRENAAYFQKISETSDIPDCHKSALNDNFIVKCHICKKWHCVKKGFRFNTVKYEKKGDTVQLLKSQNCVQKCNWRITARDVKYVDVLDDVPEIDDVFESDTAVAEHAYDGRLKGICIFYIRKSSIQSNKLL